MALKSQDIVVALDLAISSRGLKFQELATALGMSVSEVHAAANRAIASQLVVRRPEGPLAVHRRNLLEFLVHGLRYAFPPEVGEVTRGLPTSYAAPVLANRFAPGELPPVWPTSAGRVRGHAFAPLYRSVPAAAARNPALYDILALVDAARDRDARVRGIAADMLAHELAS